MLIFLISLVALVGLWDGATRRSRMSNLLLEKRFKLFKIRDELREMAIDEKIAHDRWFDYFDTTLTKMIDLLPKLSVWNLAVLVIHYRNDVGIEKDEKDLLKFLYDEKNKAYLNLYFQFVKTLGEFLFARHRILGFLCFQAAKMATAPSKVKEEATQILTVAPETSTYWKYCSN
jgi:hypothetical protein